jgi:hypothetical protein
MEKISLHLHTSENIDNIRDIVHYSLDNNIKKFDAGTNGVGNAKIDGAMAFLSAILHDGNATRFDVGAIVG